MGRQHKNCAYVFSGVAGTGTDEYYAAIWDAQESFTDWKVNGDAGSGEDPLKRSETINIDGIIYHVFTLRASSDYFTSPDGKYAGTLPAEAKIGVRGNSTGTTYPWRLYVEKKCINGIWSDLVDLGNKPNNRLLK